MASRLDNIINTLVAIYYAGIRRISHRISREFRQRRLVKAVNPPRLLGIATAVPAHVIKNLLHSDFLVFAAVTQKLTRSVFAWDAEADALLFVQSGDVASFADVDSVAWSEPGLIPASDVNRCYFMSFVEHATLLDGDPVDDLKRLDAYVARLVRAAPLGGGRLTIPWQTLSAARRLVNVVAGLAAVLGRDPSLAEKPEVARLLSHVALLRAVVAEIREDDLGYNHLASEIFAQCVADRLFGDSEALARHARELVATMTAQVGTDGLQYERSATYQCHLLGQMDALIAGQVLPEPYHGQLLQLVGTMRTALRLLTHRDGDIAVFNDAAVGDGPTPEALGVAGTAWPNGVHQLTDAGYARVEHGPYSVIFDAGPCGADDNPGHAHADFLAVEFDVGQRRLFVDPGVASYKRGIERDACRSAAEHNGPTFLGLEPIEFIGPFRVGRRGRGRFLEGQKRTALSTVAPGIGGTHDGFERHDGRVARWLAPLDDDGLLIVDVWQGLPERVARSMFLVDARSWRVEAANETQIVLSAEDGEQVFVSAVLGRLRTEDGASFHLYGPKIASPALRIVAEPTANDGGARRIAVVVHRQSRPTTLSQGLAIRLSDDLLAEIA